METIEILEGVRRLSPVLRESGIPHAFGGAIAYGLYGIPRSTNDWDVNIFLPESSAHEVFACLAPLGVDVPESAVTAVEKTGQVRLDWGGKKLDLFFAYAPFHEEARQRMRDSEFEGVPIWVLTAEDIIVFKVIFDRPHDWRDIERIFHRMGENVDLVYAVDWLEFMLGEDDSRIAHLKMVALGGSPTR